MQSNPNLTTNGAGMAGSIFFNEKKKSVNHVNLIGKVSSAPRFYEHPDGRRIAQFTLTTSEPYLDAEGNTKRRSHWHRIAAWGRWSKVLQELELQGMSVAIEGKLTTRFFFRDGQKQFISEVEVNDLIIL